MEKKSLTILIISGLILLISLAVVYLFVLPTYNQIKQQEVVTGQIKTQIDARKNYYTVVDSKVKALEAAGWAQKKDSIEVNFTSSPFFVPKLNSFFRTIVAGSGMTLSSVTSSAPVSAKSAPVSQSTDTTSATKSSSTSQVKEVQQSKPSTYFDQLQGPVNKVTVNLSVTGTYSAFKKLLSDFEGQTRIITVKSIAVSASQAGSGKKAASISSFSLVVDVYSY